MYLEYDVHCCFVLAWCRYLEVQGGVMPQLYADNLACVSSVPDVLLHTGKFTAGYVRLVGQEFAPSKSVLVSTGRDVRKGSCLMRETSGQSSLVYGIVESHLGATFRGSSPTLAARARLVISRLLLVAGHPLDFHGRIRVVRSMFIPGALHGFQASPQAQSSLPKLHAAILNGVSYGRQLFANAGAVLSSHDGSGSGC